MFEMTHKEFCKNKKGVKVCFFCSAKNLSKILHIEIAETEGEIKSLDP